MYDYSGQRVLWPLYTYMCGKDIGETADEGILIVVSPPKSCSELDMALQNAASQNGDNSFEVFR